MALIKNYYFKSKDVKVFPSSFRGTYTNSSNEETTFDPEARLNSEFNFVNAKRTSNKTSYIVEYSDDVIKFIVGGYYFEISNLRDYLDELKEQHLGIKVRTIELTTDINIDGERSTTVLDTWVDNTNKVLDTSIEVDNETTYYFTGLKVLERTEALTHDSIQLFDAEGNINKKAFLVDLNHGDGETTLLHGEGLVASYENQTVFGTYNDNKEGTLFEVGNGTTELDEESNLTVENRSNALEIKSDETNIKTDLNIIPNNTNARVVVTNTETTLSSIGEINLETTKVNIEGSETLTSTAPTTTINAGTSTIIKTPTLDIQNNDGDSKVKIEDDKVTINLSTDLNGDLIVTDGKNTTLGGNTEVKGATHITSTADYNSSNQTAALKVDGGTNILKKLNVGNATTLKGTLTVTGNTTLNNNLTVADKKKTTLGGELEVNGNVDINAQTTNITGVVNINTDNQSNPGAVTIYGNTTINSNLSASGDTTLGGALEVDGTTQLNDNLTVGAEGASKTTTLNGTLEVTEDTTLKDTLTVTGDTTLNNNLTIADGKNTTLGGDLEVNGDTNLKGTLKITYIDAVDTDGTTEEVEKVSLQIEPTIIDETSVEQLTVAVPTILNDTLTVDGAITLNNNLTVASGNTTLSGDLTVAGKATSASTVDTDGDTTLTTKGYVEAEINAARAYAEGLIIQPEPIQAIGVSKDEVDSSQKQIFMWTEPYDTSDTGVTKITGWSSSTDESITCKWNEVGCKAAKLPSDTAKTATGYWFGSTIFPISTTTTVSKYDNITTTQGIFGLGLWVRFVDNDGWLADWNTDDASIRINLQNLIMNRLKVEENEEQGKKFVSTSISVPPESIKILSYTLSPIEWTTRDKINVQTSVWAEPFGDGNTHYLYIQSSHDSDKMLGWHIYVTLSAKLSAKITNSNNSVEVEEDNIR